MSAPPAAQEAELALERLVGSSAELRCCALVDAGGQVIATSAPGEWADVATELWAAAGLTAGPAATQIHVATESGELFAVRSGAITALALADRFALASLMLCDLRAVLRELGSG